MGLCERTALCPPIFATFDELKQRITSVQDNVTRHMVQRVWLELNYRLDVGRVTGAAHIEHMKSVT